jgi:Right handed beta helix region
MYSGLLVGTGSNYVTIQGFRIRHAAMGVGFTGTASHDTVQDVDASFNYPMGFWTGSGYNTFRRVTGTRNTLQLIKLDNGANHNLVEYATGTQNLGQGIKLTGASNASNTVRYSTFTGGKDVPGAAGAYGGYIQGVDIEEGAHDNVIQSNVISRNRRGLMLYQVTSSGKPLNANTIRSNTFTSNDTAVVIWDGKYSATNGAGTVTFTRNTYASNGVGVATEATTSHKTFDHETFYKTGASKVVAASTFYLKAGTLTLKNSIVSTSAGYGFYLKTGAKLTVTYTSIYSTGLGVRNSTAAVLGTGWNRTNPAFLTTVSSATDYLYIGPSSAVYKASSTGAAIGARWR